MNAITTVLPDVALSGGAEFTALDWVGMEQIALPVRWDDQRYSAVVDAGVDLIDSAAKGIHMSRLYGAVQCLTQQRLAPPLLHSVLRSMLDSHRGLSCSASLRLRFEHLLLRPALRSDQSGWQRYPVEVTCELSEQGPLRIQLAVEVPYASTCPCSAALARQLNANAFAEAFGDRNPVDKTAVVDWLNSPAGLSGVPHAQRSVAHVAVELAEEAAELPLDALLDRIESALGTPVQTAVKREDEQAFAALMARNLMFCEDAARRVQAALRKGGGIAAYWITVRHHESLHAHAAVARVRGFAEGRQHDSSDHPDRLPGQR